MVYAHDSKSCLERDEGSSPSSGTTNVVSEHGDKPTAWLV